MIFYDFIKSQLLNYSIHYRVKNYNFDFKNAISWCIFTFSSIVIVRLNKKKKRNMEKSRLDLIRIPKLHVQYCKIIFSQFCNSRLTVSVCSWKVVTHWIWMTTVHRYVDEMHCLWYYWKITDRNMRKMWNNWPVKCVRRVSKTIDGDRPVYSLRRQAALSFIFYVIIYYMHAK